MHAVASRGIVPVVLGGDHSITWPAATAVADVHGYGNVGIVHFDAHADTADEIEGNLASHGTRCAGSSSPARCPAPTSSRSAFAATGRRRTPFEWMLEQGMTWHTMQEIWDRGFKDVHARRRQPRHWPRRTSCTSRSTSTCSTPRIAPGTGTPEPGGITSADLLRLVRQLCYEHDVAGVDVVEVAPAYDHAELTVNAAHRVVFEAPRRDGRASTAMPRQAKPGPPALMRRHRYRRGAAMAGPPA